MRSFTRSANLIRHQATHTHTFKCLEYEKSFSCSSDLIGHQRIHMEEKTHQWSACERGFLLGMDFIAQQKIRTQTEEPHYTVSVIKAFIRAQPFFNIRQSTLVKNHISVMCLRKVLSSALPMYQKPHRCLDQTRSCYTLKKKGCMYNVRELT